MMRPINKEQAEPPCHKTRQAFRKTKEPLFSTLPAMARFLKVIAAESNVNEPN